MSSLNEKKREKQSPVDSVPTNYCYYKFRNNVCRSLIFYFSKRSKIFSELFTRLFHYYYYNTRVHLRRHHAQLARVCMSSSDALFLFKYNRGFVKTLAAVCPPPPKRFDNIMISSAAARRRCYDFFFFWFFFCLITRSRRILYTGSAISRCRRRWPRPCNLL